MFKREHVDNFCYFLLTKQFSSIILTEFDSNLHLHQLSKSQIVYQHSTRPTSIIRSNGHTLPSPSIPIRGSSLDAWLPNMSETRAGPN
ncbi:uncharacterized protein Bfra_002688 [Botrytis fragariae]|uniref:Uncharacterized protein n=1 Tax=Botrytis fragariae TaxID=1964551 RepID=A0A8H6ELG5_9HELO|nr:uncharacterized protein Bfra_002688 [Botrytis fragariae]KAF5876285.1 hypothetical protein Bfra_002688 [Botrytis fragariae]